MYRRSIALFVMLIASSMLVPAASAQESTFVYVFDDGVTYEVQEGDEVILIYGWAAKTKGQVRTYIAANADSFSIVESGTGTAVTDLGPDEADDYWGPLETIATADLGLNCKKGEFWLSVWTYSLGTLPAGTYTLFWSTSLERPVNDGYHNCDEVVAPSLYPPGDFGTAEVTIIVG